MPRYFFNIRYVIDDVDQEGTELPDRNAVWREAIRSSGEILVDVDGGLPPGVPWIMEVIDERGKLVMKVTIIAEQTPRNLH